MKRNKMKLKMLRRGLRAIGIAKILFEYEGYHTRYLESIENHLREVLKNELTKRTTSMPNTTGKKIIPVSLNSSQPDSLSENRPALEV
jgi:hypothetical protein